MLDWPWKKPRSADSKPTKNTAGDRQRMANQLCSELMTPASHLQSTAIPTAPVRPSAKKSVRETR